MSTNSLLDDEVLASNNFDSDFNFGLSEHIETFGKIEDFASRGCLYIKPHENDWFERLVFTP